MEADSVWIAPDTHVISQKFSFTCSLQISLFSLTPQVLKDHGQDYLVGNHFTWADVHLLEAILMAEECKSDILSKFPLLQVSILPDPNKEYNRLNVVIQFTEFSNVKIEQPLAALE